MKIIDGLHKGVQLPGVVCLELDSYKDPRGSFMETWSRCKYHEVGINADFVQDNHSVSRRHVVRGLHYSLDGVAKLVRVAFGEVLDVVVDLRKGSPCFGKWASYKLSSENCRQLFIPGGFAHGFIAVKSLNLFQYKVDRYYNRELDRGIRWNDPELGIEWETESGVAPDDAVLSEKDRELPFLSESQIPFVYEV